VGNFALFVWDRDPESGSLQLVESFQDDNAAELVEGTNILKAEPIADATIVDGLGAVQSLALSPDGAHVYTAGTSDRGLGVFERDQESGRLSFVEAVKDPPNEFKYGLILAADVDVSPDGRHVYVASMAGFLAAFERDAGTGRLTWLERIADGKNGVERLDGANSVVVGPNGTDLFVASYKAGAIARFKRDANTGRLSFVGAVKDGECDCSTLGRSYFATISPDGRHLYNCSQEHTVGVFAIPETPGPETPGS
jgi:6-phosphogluconolactonase (cycloisomerase 2 family)